MSMKVQTLEKNGRRGDDMRKFSATVIAAILLASMASSMVGAFRGDINGDGTVNSIDLSLLGQAWGSHTGDFHYNRCADLNCDGVIDLTDLSILGQYWGEERDYVETFVMSEANEEILSPQFYQYASDLEGYYLVADVYTDGCVKYWEIWLRKIPDFPNCSSDTIYVKTEVTYDYICDLTTFLSSIDKEQLLIDAGVALVQGIIGAACSVSCLYCTVASGFLCGAICAPACLAIEFAPLNP
jgi:hypothetical protein